MNDCILTLNPMSGHIGSHNGRCSRGIESESIHLAPTHHAKVNGWCGHICQQCAGELAKRKDAIVRELNQG